VLVEVLHVPPGQSPSPLQQPVAPVEPRTHAPDEQVYFWQEPGVPQVETSLPQQASQVVLDPLPHLLPLAQVQTPLTQVADEPQPPLPQHSVGQEQVPSLHCSPVEQSESTQQALPLTQLLPRLTVPQSLPLAQPQVFVAVVQVSLVAQSEVLLQQPALPLL
jgi:hypothetical protein